MRFAAITTDGTVWGVGDSREEASFNAIGAFRELGERSEPFEIFEVSEETEPGDCMPFTERE